MSVLVVMLNCSEDINIEEKIIDAPIEDSTHFQRIDFNSVPKSVLDLLPKNIRQLNQNQRQSSLENNADEGNEVHEIIRVTDSLDNETYTFGLELSPQESDMDLYFDNIIISTQEGGYYKFIKRYRPNLEWLYHSSDFSTYTGIIEILDFDHNLVYSKRMANGSIISDAVGETSRSSETTTNRACDWQEMVIGHTIPSGEYFDWNDGYSVCNHLGQCEVTTLDIFHCEDVPYYNGSYPIYYSSQGGSGGTSGGGGLSSGSSLPSESFIEN